MEFNVFETEEEVINAYMENVVKFAASSIKSRGRFNISLSGGNSPKKVYELLASAVNRDKVEWEKVFFFFGDERYVPSDSPESNALMVQHALFAPLGIRDDHVFKVNTSLPSDDAAYQYSEAIKGHFGGGVVRFDYVMLGLGGDAHTASLFPYTEVLKITEATVKAVKLVGQNTIRISMTAPLLNQARHIVFLTFGEGKAKAIYQVVKGDLDHEQFPAQLINPPEGSVEWYTDKAAMSLLGEIG